jgi:hypothetical protein
MENGLKLTVALTVSAATFAAAGAAQAHHSFAMFDQEHPIEIAGTVVEFRYTNPHSYILLTVKEPGSEDNTVWTLEGPSPSLLSHKGITAKTINPGDQLVLTIDPLRTGAPGGMWSPSKTWWSKDWRPIAEPKEAYYPDRDGTQNQQQRYKHAASSSRCGRGALLEQEILTLLQD